MAALAEEDEIVQAIRFSPTFRENGIDFKLEISRSTIGTLPFLFFEEIFSHVVTEKSLLVDKLTRHLNK